MTTTEDEHNQNAGRPRKKVRVNITGRVVIKRSDAAAFLDKLAERLAHAAPLPLDFSGDVQKLKGAIVNARPTTDAPGVYNVRVLKDDRLQHTPTQVAEGIANELVPHYGAITPQASGQAVPERAAEIVRAVLDARGRWRDPKTGHFTLDPSAVRGE